MTTTNKKFDCVQMKDRIQHQLWQEYEKRKSEFSSYSDFINSAANESDEIRNFRKRLARPGTCRT